MCPNVLDVAVSDITSYYQTTNFHAYFNRRCLFVWLVLRIQKGISFNSGPPKRIYEKHRKGLRNPPPLGQHRVKLYIELCP